MVRAVSLQASDFQRALGSRPVSRTAHFVLHALQASPCSQPTKHPAAPAEGAKLSTGDTADTAVLVDDCVVAAAAEGPRPWSLGLVLPKKQARRSVTRSLIRHQAREALRRHASAVAQAAPVSAQAVSGWVVRLRSPFDRQQYPSAASEALKVAVRQEMDELWGRLARSAWRLPEPGTPREPRR